MKLSTVLDRTGICLQVGKGDPLIGVKAPVELLKSKPSIASRSVKNRILISRVDPMCRSGEKR